MAIAFFAEPGAPHRRHRFAATKIRATRFATSLPQDLPAHLMFDWAKLRLPRPNPLAWFGILRRPVRRSRGAASQMPHKCLSGRRFRAAHCAGCPPCGSSASSHTLFRVGRARRGRELPSVCRDVPEVCRMT